MKDFTDSKYEPECQTVWDVKLFLNIFYLALLHTHTHTNQVSWKGLEDRMAGHGQAGNMKVMTRPEEWGLGAQTRRERFGFRPSPVHPTTLSVTAPSKTRVFWPLFSQLPVPALGWKLHAPSVNPSILGRPTLCYPMNCSPPGPSVHGILQTRILEWVTSSFSRESSQLRDPTCGSISISCIAGRLFYHWATGKAVCIYYELNLETTGKYMSIRQSS